jgi:hypothetical protein
MTTVEEYARGIVTDQRDPPRAVSLWPLVARSYASRAGLITLGIGLVLCLPVLVVAAFVAEGTTAERIVLVSILGAVTSVSILSAGIRALRIWRGLVKGLLATGEVLRPAWAGPSLRPETVDAQVQGLTRGTWRIVHPVLGEFDASFESDAPWASELRKGTHVSVLVEAGTRRVVLDLGPGGLHQ